MVGMWAPEAWQGHCGVVASTGIRWAAAAGLRAEGS